MVKYQIANVTDRNNTDLTQYQTALRNSVITIADNALVPNSFHVYNRYFEFDVTGNFSQADGSKMGKEIVANSSNLNALVKSGHLFERF